MQACAKAVVDNHGPTEGMTEGTKAQKETADQIMKCLELAFIKHLKDKINEKRKEDGDPPATDKEVRKMEIGWEVNPTVGRMWA